MRSTPGLIFVGKAKKGAYPRAEAALLPANI